MKRCAPLVGVLILSPSVCAQASFQGLGHDPGGFPWSKALGISADGVWVVGTVDTAEGATAFRWTAAGGMVAIGDLPGGGHLSVATGVSGDGSVVTGYSAAENYTEAFRWTAETGMVGLGGLVIGHGSHGSAVSDDGATIVGYSAGGDPYQACLWTEQDGVVGLGFVPGNEKKYSAAHGVSGDGGVVIGHGWGSSFLWTKQAGMVQLTEISAQGISSDGGVIVGGSPPTDDNYAARWTADAGVALLGHLPGGELASRAIEADADGSVIVGHSTLEYDDQGDAVDEAWFWAGGEVLRGIREFLLDAGVDQVAAWRLEFAADISADGSVIVGYGINPDGHTEAWIAHIVTNCYPDFSEDGVLDLFDFLAFVNLFNAGDPNADCTGDAILDLFDFLCFVNAFNQGC